MKSVPIKTKKELFFDKKEALLGMKIIESKDSSPPYPLKFKVDES